MAIDPDGCFSRCNEVAPSGRACGVSAKCLSNVIPAHAETYTT
jgi:hypothetical protein